MRTLCYLAPGATVTDVQDLKNETLQPLTVFCRVRSFGPEQPMPVSGIVVLGLLVLSLISAGLWQVRAPQLNQGAQR